MVMVVVVFSPAACLCVCVIDCMHGVCLCLVDGGTVVPGECVCMLVYMSLLSLSHVSLCVGVMLFVWWRRVWLTCVCVCVFVALHMW